MAKIFLSPSDQARNVYAYGNTVEQVQCERIAQACKIALERSGVDVRVAANDLDDWDEGHINPSNRFNPDLHIAIHTNAYNGKSGGVQVYYGNAGATAARNMLNSIKAVFPESFPTNAEGINGSKVNSWSEFYDVVADVLYVEANFHDVPEIAKYIIEHTTEIGEAIAKSACDYVKVKYVAPASIAKPEAEKIYRVQVGAFKEKANAEKMLDKIKAAGFDAFITSV